MITLSLLKNIEEFRDAKVKLLPIMSEGIQPTNEWLQNEFMNWSKQLPEFRADVSLIVFNFFVAVFDNSSISKERLLSAIRIMEAIFYTDVFLGEACKEKSASKAKQVIENLINAVKSGHCADSFNPGKRVIESVKQMKNDLSSEQWAIVEMHFINYYTAHLDIHCNYSLKGKFLSLGEYGAKRTPESGWHIFIFLVEYSIDCLIATEIRNNAIVNNFNHNIVELCLAVDDYVLAKYKIMRNDVTTRVISYLYEKRCGLQKALDIQYEYVMHLYKECNDLKDKIKANPQIRSEQLSLWMDTTFNYIFAQFIVVKSLDFWEVNDDQTVSSVKWDQFYNEQRSKSKID